MITCRSTGLVYRNPHPNLRAVHTWHPSISRFDDGELVATFDLGQAVESLDYRTYLSRSTDDGKSWSEPVRVFEDVVAERTTHSVRTSRVRDDALVGIGARFYRDNPDVGLVNHKNLGFVRMDLLLLESRDRGRSWQGPRVIEPPLVGPAFELCHSIVELQDGRWLAPMSTWKGWNGEAPNGMNAIALVSHDRGRTWPEYLKIMAAYDQGVVHWEQSLVELPGGRLLSVAWALHEASGRTQPTPYAISQDRRTFGPPRPTGFLGQTAKILRLADGRILCVYRRDDRPGLWANLARIEGNGWINLAEAPLWQGVATSGMLGRQTPGEELSSLKFGYPTLTQMADGDVLVLFWCCEDCIYNIRWLRVAIG
jgi:hypothetical protein